ncbi:hypothetical protein, partial [Escherichia coli]|uniref:hypothetical protein n=1 Tax=Escherichia coli TaxID=562 RepID=UPI001BDCB1ED
LARRTPAKGGVFAQAITVAFKQCSHKIPHLNCFYCHNGIPFPKDSIPANRSAILPQFDRAAPEKNGRER